MTSGQSLRSLAGGALHWGVTLERGRGGPDSSLRSLPHWVFQPTSNLWLLWVLRSQSYAVTRNFIRKLLQIEIRLLQPPHLTLHHSYILLWSSCPPSSGTVKPPKFRQDEFSTLTSLLLQSPGPNRKGVRTLRLTWVDTLGNLEPPNIPGSFGPVKVLISPFREWQPALFKDNAEPSMEAGTWPDNGCPPHNLLIHPILDQKRGSNLSMAQLEKFRPAKGWEGLCTEGAAGANKGTPTRQARIWLGMDLEDAGSREVAYKSR